jgi:hypothetical protein
VSDIWSIKCRIKPKAIGFTGIRSSTSAKTFHYFNFYSFKIKYKISCVNPWGIIGPTSIPFLKTPP